MWSIYYENNGKYNSNSNNLTFFTHNRDNITVNNKCKSSVILCNVNSASILDASEIILNDILLLVKI